MKAITRIILWFQLYALEIHIAWSVFEQWDKPFLTLFSSGDPITRGNMDISRSNARTNLARLRSNYNATLPAGQRRTWHMA